MDAMDLPANKYCPIARSLGILGQKWNLLLLREAFLGSTRYAEFAKIGIPTDILATRLAALVEAGLLERRPYQAEGSRTRDEYVLTDAGRDTLPILGAISAWGNEHRPLRGGKGARFTTATDEQELAVAFVDSEQTIIPMSDVRVHLPGADELAARA